MQVATNASGVPAPPIPQAKAFDFDQWLMILCSQTGVRVTDIPAEVLEMLRAKGNKNDVNKMFFMWHEEFNKPKPVIVPEGVKEKFKQLITVRSMPEYVRANQSIIQLTQEVARYFGHIENHLRSMHQHRVILDRLEGRDNIDLWPMIEECLADGWYTLNVPLTERGMNIIPGSGQPYVVFDTPRITIQHFNAKAGINQNVDMGRYRVFWYPLESVIRVELGEGCIEIDSCIHPHILGGNVCWGNAKEAYLQGMKTYKPKAALEALRVILQTYNAESPYRSLTHWETERLKDRNSGNPKMFRIHNKEAWVFGFAMPDSWATTYEQDSGEASEGPNRGERIYLMQVFEQVYTDGSPIPGEQNRFYVRTRNGRHHLIGAGDIYSWGDDETNVEDSYEDED